MSASSNPELPLDPRDYEGVCVHCGADVANHGSGWFHIDGQERDHRAQPSTGCRNQGHTWPRYPTQPGEEVCQRCRQVRVTASDLSVTYRHRPTPSWLAPTTSVKVSDHARQHPEHYGLRKTMWAAGGVIHVELALMDAEGEFIDEAGCNCDLDSPCNNPRCVMERGHFY